MEQKLKERLIGTAVITALAVIFLPMLIDEDDQRWVQQEAAVDVPPLPDKFKNKPTILSEAGIDDRQLFQTSKKPLGNSGIASQNQRSSADVRAGLTNISPPVIKKPVLKTPAIKTPVVKQKPPGMDQQLDSLLPSAKQKVRQQANKQEESLQQLKSRQQNSRKAASILEPIARPSSPKPSRSLIANTNPTPSLVPAIKPKANKATSRPDASKSPNSDLTGLWVVQAGVFKEKSNAEALRKKLSDNGFSAYLESVKTELGVLIRVRAGRVPQEQAARQMVKTLNKRFSIKSITFPETKWNSKRAGK